MTKIYSESESRMTGLYKKGKSMKEISEIFNVSSGTVCMHLKKHIPVAERRKRQFPKLKTNEKILSDIERLYKKGFSSVAIGRKFDMNPESVLYHLHRMNVDMSRGEKHKPKIDSHKLEEVKRLYIENGSILKTAKQFGLHPASVHYRLVKLGIVKKKRLDQKAAKEKYEMFTDVLVNMFKKMGYEIRYVQLRYNGHGPDMIIENKRESILIEHKATIKRSWYWQHALEEIKVNLPKYNVTKAIVVTTAMKPKNYKSNGTQIIFFDDLKKLLERNELQDLIPKIEHISNTPSI